MAQKAKRRKRSPKKQPLLTIVGEIFDVFPIKDPVAQSNPAALVVEGLRKRFEEEGDDQALLDAVDFCLRTATVVPPWAAIAWAARYEDWFQFRAQTLDAAFKAQRKKHKSHRRRVHRRPYVVARMTQLTKGHGQQVRQSLVQVGKELGISSATVRAIYYERLSDNWRKFFESLIPPISQNS